LLKYTQTVLNAKLYTNNLTILKSTRIT